LRISKSTPLEYDPEKWIPVSPRANAERLPGNHAQTKT
jgi:hypothetical protein